MKENKIEKIGSFVMIGILVIMMFSSILFTIVPKLLIRLDLTNEKINDFFQITKPTTRIDYSKIYPFEDQENNLKSSNNLKQKYLSAISSMKEKIENSTSIALLGYEKLIEFSYVYDNIINYKIVSNNSDSRIEIEDGYYSRIYGKKNIDNCANDLIELNNYLKKSDIDFLYVQAPFKISESQKLSSIYSDYTNENMDKLLGLLNGKVNYLDIRENIKKNNFDNLKLFYKTDHHWLPETGLWATQELSEYLNENYDMNLEIENIDKSNYEFKVYPHMYLGADGRRVSLAKASPEDFTLILPKFDTKLRIKIPEKNIDKIGNYQDTVIDWEQVKYKNYYKIDQYAAYMYGERQLIEIKNEYVNNNKKILLIKDSFSDVISPFLALENEYLSIIDLRFFDGSLKRYITEYKPDIVITIYNGAELLDNSEIAKDKIDYLWDNLNK